jgi:hypothetical protein
MTQMEPSVPVFLALRFEDRELPSTVVRLCLRGLNFSALERAAVRGCAPSFAVDVVRLLYRPQCIRFSSGKYPLCTRRLTPAGDCPRSDVAYLVVHPVGGDVIAVAVSLIGHPSLLCLYLTQRPKSESDVHALDQLEISQQAAIK